MECGVTQIERQFEVGVIPVLQYLIRMGNFGKLDSNAPN